MDKWEYQNKPRYLENRVVREPCKQRTACTIILSFDQRSNWFWPHESKTQYLPQLSKLLNIILPRIMAPVMTKKRGALLSLQMSLLIFLTPIINNALLNIKPIRQKYFLLVLILNCFYFKPSWYIAGKRLCVGQKVPNITQLTNVSIIETFSQLSFGESRILY